MNNLQKTSVLVVDGNSEAVKRISMGLAQDTYRVIASADVESGLDDLVLLDPVLVVLHLPHQMNGKKLVRRFRQASQAPLIVLVDNQDPSVRIESLLEGADFVLPTSVGIRELRSRMRVLVWRSQRPHPPGA